MEKMKRSYRIFLLFLLLSMSVFAGQIKTTIEKISTNDSNIAKIELMSVTFADMKKLELVNLKEKRDGKEKIYGNIDARRILIPKNEKVLINNSQYTVSDNRVYIGGRNQYIYRWEATYPSEFKEKDGMIRTAIFDAKRTVGENQRYTEWGLNGKYKEPNKPIGGASSQWVYSQIAKENLVDSDKYTVDFYENVDSIKTIDKDGSLEELLKLEGGYSGTDIFSEEELERYKYIGTPKSIIEFKLKETIDKSKNVQFKLTIEENGVFKRNINENYMIPVPITDFKVQDLEVSKNTFTYKDNYELENLKAYKYQEVVFRLYKGSKHDGIRPIKKIEENDLKIIKNDNNYVDFVFENNGTPQEIEKDGVKGRFVEGKFELIGLENEEPYKLDFYTLRYRNNHETGNYVAITYESSLGFTGKNISSTNDSVWLEDIDTSGYKIIKLNLVSVTTKEISSLNLGNLKEKRNNNTKNILNPPATFELIPMAGNTINIDGKSYTIDQNHQIILDQNNKRYVYRWKAEYETIFDDENGIEREVKFDVEGENLNKISLIGKYIEPTPVEEDTGPSHQWVMFEFNPAKEFKNQNYKIEDRVLTPKRKGYRQLKTLNYENNLEDVLYGNSGYSSPKEFNYNNGVWKYPIDKNSTGLIIEKTISESKGNFKGEDNNEMLFYTDNIGNGIEKITNESKGNKATFRWNEGPINTNGEILSYDKVIFRITKKSDGVDYSWNPYTNEKPINYIDETEGGNKKLEDFLFGNDKYIDLVLDASTSKTITLNNAIISYEQTNKELRVVGLPVGEYNIQFYSVKRGHDGTYKVITREKESEKEKEFKMDIPDIASEDFEKENNIHKIDFITTGSSDGNIRVNVNFITKMERAIDLKVENLKSGDFNIEETIKGTGKKEGIGEAGKISLKESDMKKFLFPLDVIFVIDNSGSMQNEIDNVKNGLSAFGQKLLDRGFDVKYNLITFGPQQISGTIGNWANNIAEYKDHYGYYYYMATYKSGWFDGSKLGKTSSPENDLEELTDAFSRIRAGGGYPYGQENSAWGIHNAIEKLRENGRYLSYSGEIVEDSAKGYMPSEKMIIFLTDENMDGENLPSGYDEDDVLEKLYSKLNGTYKGMPDNIDLNGIFHVKKDGNTAEGANEYLTRYDDVPGLGYKYTSGYKEKKEWLYYSKKEWINQGWIRKEQWDRYYANNPDYRMEDESIYYSYGYWRRMGHMWKYEWERGGYANNPDYRIDRSNTNKVWYSKREWQQQRQPISREYWNTYYVNNENYRIDEEHVLYSYAQWTSQRAITREEWEQNYEGDSDYRLDRVVDLGGEWIEYDDNETPILGIDPADDGDISHTDFKYYNTANNFFMYEMGSRGEHVSKALDLAINNLGIIQRWELSYLTPFNEYDGTTRTIDFELVNLIGKDGTPVNRKITNLNQVEDKQYTVKEEKLALEFVDPSVDNLRLSIVDGKGSITFRGKARYNEFDKDNNPIVVEDMINEYKLDVLDSNNKLLFSRNTNNIEMSLSDKGWLKSKVTKSGITNVLANRRKSWVKVENISGKNILDYIVKTRYIVEGVGIYKIELMDSEVEKIKKLTEGDLKLKVGGVSVEVDEKEFEKLMKGRSDTWYELKNTSTTPNLLDDIKHDNFEKIKDNEYKIKLSDIGVKELLSSGENSEGIDLKISNTKLNELSNASTLSDTFGDQGWYQFKIDLTGDEIEILKNSETVKSTEKVNLEARIVTDILNKMEVLKDVEVDLSTPKIINVNLNNKTLFKFLNTMHSLDSKKTFTDSKKYSGYDVEVGSASIISNEGSYGKKGDKVDLVLIVEGKNIDKYDIVNGIKIEGWSKPEIEPDSGNDNSKMKKFIVTWKDQIISDNVVKGLEVKNTTRNQYGITASQDIVVLKFDNEINISPKVKYGNEDVKLMDNIYYVNSNYGIDLGTSDSDLRAGIVKLSYDKTKSDNQDGKPENYYPINTNQSIFGGGEKSNSIPIGIDSSDNHSTDGEYNAKVYSMSKGGKLNGVKEYLDGNFKGVLDKNSGGENIIIRVDTVEPKLMDISLEESNENSDEKHYYFDLLFKIEDFNASYKKLEDNIKGGYSLIVKNDNTEILDEPSYDGEKTITYKIKVKKPQVSNGLITEVTVIAEDKAGNRIEEVVKVRIPKNIELKVIEEVLGWGSGKKTKIKDSGKNYIFTKGGEISLINDPAIYAVVPGATDPGDDTEITKLKIEKLKEDGTLISKKIMELSGETSNVEIKFNFIKEGKNIVRVTPISKVGVEGKPKELNFIVDTKINTSYLNNEIIGSLNGKNIEVDLSKIEELSGVKKYEYDFSIEGKRTGKIIKTTSNSKSFTIPKTKSINGIEKIDTSEFIGGSNGTLSFTVYDNVGNKKTFKKTYFIPKESQGIVAKVSGEAGERESKLNILASGIELKSIIDRSGEYRKEDDENNDDDTKDEVKDEGKESMKKEN